MAITLLKPAPKKRIVNRSALIRDVGSMNFRYVEDVVRYLQDLDQEVDDILHLGKIHQRSITAHLLKAGLSLTITTNDPGTNSPKVPLKKTQFVKSLPLEKLEQSYGVIQDLYDRLKSVELIEAELKVKFKEIDASAVKKATAPLELIKAKIAKGLQAAFSFLSDVAEAHEPPSFASLCSSVAAALENGVRYESVTSYLYVYVKDEQIVFSRYIMLSNATDDNGKVFRSLSIVLSCVMADQGPEFFLALNDEFVPPGKLNIGKQVTNAKHAFTILTHLFDVENFESGLARLPLQLFLNPKSLKPSLFSFEKYISELRVEEDSVGFLLKPIVKKDDADLIAKITTQLNLEMQALVRATKARMRTSVQYPSDGVCIRFEVVRAGGELQAHPDDLEFLKTRFGLSDANIADVVKIINVNA